MSNLQIIEKISQMQEIGKSWNETIGFVPTMGYLHQGHLSLVKAAKKECDIVVVSIYVNPTQFSPNEDLNTYPRDFEKDLKLLSDLEVDYVFFPSNSEMYPDGYKTWVMVDEITEMLCGKSRPTHFRGVTTIVSKLMNIVNPDYMYMGEKDFQQVTVLKQMVRDLNFKTEIRECSIVREDDGLAMSSRNKNIKTEDREKALCLNKALKLAQKLFDEGITDATVIIKKITELINDSNAVPDYIEIVDHTTLKTTEKAYSGCRILLAVFVGKIRLIDNAKLI